MRKQFFNLDDYDELLQKLTFLSEYTLRNGRNKGLKEVEVQHLADLAHNKIDQRPAIDYFNNLNDEFTKAFKTAWRQRLHKEKNKYKTKTFELTSMSEFHLAKMVAVIGKNNKSISKLTVAKQREVALEIAVEALKQCLADPKNKVSYFTKTVLNAENSIKMADKDSI